MSDQKKILAVDDESDSLEFIKAILEPEGFIVVTATNGQDAIKKVGSEKPDLVIMDVMMPVLDGYDACSKLKSDKSTSSTPVILLTAIHKHITTTSYSLRQGMEIEADDYIPKPVSPEGLLKSVRELLHLQKEER